MEIIDIVNEQDEVVGTIPFAELYDKWPMHRVVHVLLFDREGRMALQMRSKHKAFCPRHWSTAVGGHVQRGEDYEQAALRECREELGIALPISIVSKYRYEHEQGKAKFVTVFRATHEGPFTCNPEEVDHVAFFTVEQLEEMVAAGEKFHPELLFILKQKLYA
jgi:isopentenyldiphosphate isomerase